MKTVLIVAALLVAIQTHAQVVLSDFHSVNPLVDVSTAVNGTWHNNILDSGTGQEVGILLGSTGKGQAFSDTFSPVDVSSDLHLSWAYASGGPFTLHLFDNVGHESVATVTTPATTIPLTSFAGNADLSHITQFELQGDGTDTYFHANFKNLSFVPEPSEWAAVIGLGLVAFVASRKISAAKVQRLS